MAPRILALVVMAGAWLGWEYLPQPQSVAAQPATPRAAWAYDLLTRLGNPAPTADTIAFVVAWQTEENTAAQFNPLATSQDAPGATRFNGSNVKDYPSYEVGMNATMTTLQYPAYAGVLAGLQANDPAGALAALAASPWAEEAGYGERIRALWQAPQGAAKCPYTATMQVGDGSYFDSTGSAAWAGQWGGMHLGDDFVGQRGDPVYAPFDMVVESVGEYTDAARFGRNIQARFADGTLYYAGHLVDVYVSAGQHVAACTVIATLGATDQPHTHIKLGAPGAPVPCEGSQPGVGGCIDPLEYWRMH